MKTTSILLALAATLTILAPSVMAQGVAGCTQECKPKDDDVNGMEPKTGDSGVKVILYGHFEDILNRAPLNTQEPDPNQEADLNKGFLMPVVDTNVNPAVDLHFKNNEFIMYSSPGLVEYLPQGWRTHQEPGLSADVRIADATFNLYWYMSASNVPNQGSGSGSAGVMPQVAVYAKMVTGRFPNAGDLLAESESDPAPGSTARYNIISAPGQPDVYEFKVPMAVRQKIIPSDQSKNGFIVYINPYQVKSGETVQVAQADWRIRTGPNFPPRLVVPIENPMETKATSLSLFDNRMFIRWSFVSVWGSYDLNDASLQLRSTGPQPIDAANAVEFIILKRSVDHDGHFKPVNATWALDYRNFPLADGSYELTASILNRQETYRLEQKFAFTVANGVPQVQSVGNNPGGAPGGPQARDGGDSPGLGPLLLIGTIAVAALLIRRRN